jgi:hypothetical protein
LRRQSRLEREEKEEAEERSAKAFRALAEKRGGLVVEVEPLSQQTRKEILRRLNMMKKDGTDELYPDVFVEGLDEDEIIRRATSKVIPQFGKSPILKYEGQGSR